MSNDLINYNLEYTEYLKDKKDFKVHTMNKAKLKDMYEKNLSVLKELNFNDDVFDADYCSYINWLLGEI